MLAIAGLALAVLAGAFAVAVRIATALPAPNGPYPVGTTSIVLDRRATADGPSGTFAVTLWYPSEPSRDRALYEPGGSGLKNFIYRHLVRTYAARDAPIAANGKRFPLLIYVSGWGGPATVNTVLATELASFGYVVAGLGDTDFDRPPVARLAGQLDLSSASAFAATVRLAREKIDYEARRVVLVLDRLAALDAFDPKHRLTNRLESGRVGLFGFSLGGAVALAACNLERRCAGAIDLDGYLWDVRKTRQFAYFLMTSQEPPANATGLEFTDPVAYYAARMDAADQSVQQANLASGGYELQIGGAKHLNFTDVPLYAPLQNIESPISPPRTAQTIDRYALAFFDTIVKDRTAPLLRADAPHPDDIRFSEWPITRNR